MSEATKRGGSLEETRAALARWRRVDGGGGKPIPAALWSAVVEVARAQGVGATARALRLNSAKVARLVAAAPRAPMARCEGRPAAAPGFVAVEGLRLAPSRESSMVVELASKCGDRMRVELTGDVRGIEFASLARAFWGRGT